MFLGQHLLGLELAQKVGQAVEGEGPVLAEVGDCQVAHRVLAVEAFPEEQVNWIDLEVGVGVRIAQDVIVAAGGCLVHDLDPRGLARLLPREVDPRRQGGPQIHLGLARLCGPLGQRRPQAPALPAALPGRRGGYLI